MKSASSRQDVTCHGCTEGQTPEPKLAHELYFFQLVGEAVFKGVAHIYIFLIKML